MMTLAVVSLLSAVGLLVLPTTSARSRLGEGVSPAAVEATNSPKRTFAPDTGLRGALLLATGGCVPVAGVIFGWPVALTVAVALGGWWYRTRRGNAREASEPLRLAAGWDLLAAGLRAGLPVPVIVRAVAAELPTAAASALRQVADSLALGADPVAAWEPALRHTDTAGLAHAARRTARTGSGLATVAEDIASRARASMDEQAQARAQRATVWVSAPLGLCFLPAFLCLGVLPVVVGMVHEITEAW